MLAIAVILIIAIYLAFVFPSFERRHKPASLDEKYAPQMKKLWSVAQTSMKERKLVRAEKALLTILKFDEKNAAAYNRLGILYAKEQRFRDAIECFEIAQSLDRNASSFHNVGLIYLETGAYEKAAMAFSQALELEGGMSARYIALAKAEEKLGHKKSAIDALESAFELDHNVAILRQILSLHESNNDTEAIAATTARIEQQIAEKLALKKAREAKETKSPESPQPKAKPKNIASLVQNRRSFELPSIISPSVRRSRMNANSISASRPSASPARSLSATKMTKATKTSSSGTASPNKSSANSRFGLRRRKVI